MPKSKRPLRSQSWFGRHDRDALVHRSWMKNQGFPHDLFDGRPVIGICNTWSEVTPCNAHFRELAEHIKAGVLEAGGFPLEFPVMSLGETLMRPTAMLYRNQVAMDVEESIRANPFDGVVLMMGCDKTTPALLMGAASCDLPTIGISGGPMLNGKFRGEDIGSGTHVWKFTAMLKTGEMQESDMAEVESCMSRSAGHCMTMGTASTMASMVEALGMALPTNAAIPAVDSRRKVLARLTGRRIVEMVHEDLRMSKILTREAFENAIMVNGAIGGSTNAVVHLLAIAGRIGVKLSLDDWDRLGRDMPCLVNLMPSGKYLMEDFYYAGGLPVVIREIGGSLHKKALTVNGRTIWDNCKDAVNYNADVVTPLAKPFKKLGGIAVLRGNLAPRGAVLKPSAATPKLMKHKGRAVVFEDIDDLHKRIDDPKLDVDPSCVLVLKNCGPKGYPGFPEVGNFALPAKMLKQGVTDMVRVSDARMSGTAYGTVVLHTAPEAAAGGPLALVQNGDLIELDVAKRRIHLHVSDEELARRRAKWKAPKPHTDRGWVKLYCDTVTAGGRGRRPRLPRRQVRREGGAAEPLDARGARPLPGSLQSGIFLEACGARHERASRRNGGHHVRLLRKPRSTHRPAASRAAARAARVLLALHRADALAVRHDVRHRPRRGADRHADPGVHRQLVTLMQADDRAAAFRPPTPMLAGMAALVLFGRPLTLMARQPGAQQRGAARRDEPDPLAEPLARGAAELALLPERLRRPHRQSRHADQQRAARIAWSPASAPSGTSSSTASRALLLMSACRLAAGRSPRRCGSWATWSSCAASCRGCATWPRPAANCARMVMGRVVDSYTNILTVKLFARARDEDAYVREVIDDHTGAIAPTCG